jgi:hypothetical protein
MMRPAPIESSIPPNARRSVIVRRTGAAINAVMTSRSDRGDVGIGATLAAAIGFATGNGGAGRTRVSGSSSKTYRDALRGLIAA